MTGPGDRAAGEAPWWHRPAPRRAVLLLLALLPLLTPWVVKGDDNWPVYAYCAAMFAVSGWFCWRASVLFPIERIRWQTIAVAQGLHAVAYVLAAQRSVAWMAPQASGWLGNACISVSRVLFLPALMGLRSVRGRRVRTFDYLLAILASGAMTVAIGSGADPGNGEMRVVLIMLVIAVSFAAALVARKTSTRPELRFFASLQSVYLGASLLTGFFLNVVVTYWWQSVSDTLVNLVIALPELILCDLAMRAHPVIAEGMADEFEPMFVDSLQPTMMTIAGVALSLYGFRGHTVATGGAVVAMVLCYAMRTQMFYRQLFLREQRLRLRASEMQELARRDGLTGVGNRRWFDEEGAKLLLAERSYPCSVILIDTDKFKQVNDTLGHPVGDELLRAVATVLSEVNAEVKRGCCARIGGDEFGALWPSTDAEAAQALAESIRERLAARVFEGGLRMTVSIGVGTASSPVELIALVRCADQALYLAKEAGRNAVRGRELVG